MIRPLVWYILSLAVSSVASDSEGTEGWQLCCSIQPADEMCDSHPQSAMIPPSEPQSEVMASPTTTEAPTTTTTTPTTTTTTTPTTTTTTPTTTTTTPTTTTPTTTTTPPSTTTFTTTTTPTTTTSPTTTTTTTSTATTNPTTTTFTTTTSTTTTPPPSTTPKMVRTRPTGITAHGTFIFKKLEAPEEKEEEVISEAENSARVEKYVQHERQRGFQCPYNWEFYDRTLACYLVINDTATFDNAEKDCVKRGAHLASIQSKGENTFIQGLMGNPRIILYSGLKRKVGEQWKFMDGRRMRYQDWSSEKPKNLDGVDTCGVVHATPFLESGKRHTWKYVNCKEERFYVCKQLAEEVYNMVETQ